MTVKPRVLGGFSEFNPAQQIVLERAKTLIARAFERFGFGPIETPAVEPKDVLLAKGLMDSRQIYTVSRLPGEQALNTATQIAQDWFAKQKENKDTQPLDVTEFLNTYSSEQAFTEFGLVENDPPEVRVMKILSMLSARSQTDMALHFDLTVPLAHFVAKYQASLTFPFRRYQMQKVWRGERQQSGRSREFYQCDIDVIGRGKLDVLVDAEIPSIIYLIFQEMKIGSFVIRISNAKILEEYLRFAGVAEESLPKVKGVVDELEKVGIERTVSDLSASSTLTLDQSRTVIEFLVGQDESTDEVLLKLGALSVSERFSEGVAELTAVMQGIRAFGVPDDFVRTDLTIARGLDYYTGTVYETILTDHPGLGSICSGGRYDDLAGHYTTEKFPGVGISIGLTRLLGRLLSAGLVKAEQTTVAPVLVTSMDRRFMEHYMRMASDLRAMGINTEVYLDNDPIGRQLRFASRKGFKLAVIAGDDEIGRGCAQIKNLRTASTTEYSIDNIATNVEHQLRLMVQDGDHKP